MSLGAMTPMLGIGEWNVICAGCFSLLEVLIEIFASPERETAETTGDARSLAAVASKDEARVG